MRLRSLMLLAALTFSTALPMMADTTYTYTGNPFSFTNSPYTTSEFVSGSFSVATPLGGDFGFYGHEPVVLTSFSFSDGEQTLSDADSTAEVFYITTDPVGAILKWQIQIQHTGDSAQIRTANFHFQQDAGVGANNISLGIVGFNPGNWTSDAPPIAPVSTTPEPSTLTLLGTGVLGMVGTVRRRIVRR